MNDSPHLLLEDKMKHYVPAPTPTKSAGQTIFGYIVVIAVSAFIINIIKKFFEALYRPFYYWTLSAEELVNLHIAQAKAKKEKRDERMQALKQDESNPLVQYQLRYIEHPENYVGQVENKEYLEWYQAWRAGKVEDPELRWAPEFYVGSGKVNPEFVAYLELQMKIITNRSAFLRTVKNYYPELTPKFPEIQRNLEELKGLVEEKHLQEELRKELVAMGVDDGMVKYVENVEPAKIRETALYFKKCKEFGYTETACNVMFQLGIDPGSESAQAIQKASNAMVPDRALIACGRGEIDADDVLEIAKDLKDVIELMGPYCIFSKDERGVSVYDLRVDEIMDKARARKRRANMEASLDKKAWEDKHE
jgi:hypothetical protein